MAPSVSYFFPQAAAKSRKFFRGPLRPYFDVFGLEYAYWLAQLNLSRASLICKFKLENMSRIRKSHGVLQLAVLEKTGAYSNRVTVLLCGTALFYTSDEINALVNETGKLIVVFNPDKKLGTEVMRTWHLDDDVQVQTVSSDVPPVQRVCKLFAILFFFNSTASLYGYRVSEFEAIRTKLESALQGWAVQSTYTKDLVSPFDMFFLYQLTAERKIWKNIAPASLEQEYLRLLNRRNFPLTEIHFYSVYQKQTILQLGYLKNISLIDRIVIKPEPYFADMFKVLDSKSAPKSKELLDLLIIGVWAHGGKNQLRKNFEFSKFLFQIARNRLLKEKFCLVYKPHPNKRHSRLFLGYLKHQGVIVRNGSEKIVDMIKEAEVIVSWGSISTVYAVGLRKQVIYPKNRFINFWIAYEKDDFESNGLVDVADSTPEVVQYAFLGLSKERALEREKRLYEIFGLLAQPPLETLTEIENF